MSLGQLLVSRLEFCDQPRLRLLALQSLLDFTPRAHKSRAQPWKFNRQLRSSENDQ